MILTTAALIGGAGAVFFAIGYFFGRPELAMIGAILIIGVGGAGMVSGYQVASGEHTVDREEEVLSGPTSIGLASHDSNITAPPTDAADVQMAGDGVFYAVEDGGSEVYQYRLTSFDDTTATIQGTLNVSNDVDRKSVV